MSKVQIVLDDMLASAPPRDAIKNTLQKFLEDMSSDRSSFFHLPETSTWGTELAGIKRTLAVRLPEVDTFLHLGIGGSSLGAETIVRALAPARAPTFHFLDNIDPDHLLDVLAVTNPNRALLYVVTKSGTTLETLAQMTAIFGWFEKHLGFEAAKNHLVFCTDPERGDLRLLGKEWSIPTFSIPRNLGGRFSAMSAVGLFPALVSGINTESLLQGAASARRRFLSSWEQGGIPEEADLAWRLVEAYQKDHRNITVLMPYSQKLKSLGAWFTQLWAESLGKNGLGLSPIAAVGPTDQHSILQLLRDGPADKVVGFVEITGFQNIVELVWKRGLHPSLTAVDGITLNQLMDAELGATRQVMRNQKRPQFQITLPRLDADTLGQVLWSLQTATAIAGYFLGVDPFDQPGVEEGKVLTHERIRACKKSAFV